SERFRKLPDRFGVLVPDDIDGDALGDLGGERIRAAAQFHGLMKEPADCCPGRRRYRAHPVLKPLQGPDVALDIADQPFSLADAVTGSCSFLVEKGLVRFFQIEDKVA